VHREAGALDNHFRKLGGVLIACWNNSSLLSRTTMKVKTNTATVSATTR
jgi:hypothetical protein